MGKLFVLSVVVLNALFGATPSQAKQDLAASWNNGIRLESEDNSFKIKFGGRLMNDWAWFQQSGDHERSFGNFQDGTEFRRTRLYMSGSVYESVLFKFQYDWAGGKVSLKDMYVGINDVPIAGTITVGHQHEPFGLETLTSSKYITFIERSFTSEFAPARNSGFLAHRVLAKDRATFSAGVFRDTSNDGKSVGDGNYAGTVRLTGLPWEEKGRGFIHLGIAYSYRDPNGPMEYKAKPESHLAKSTIGFGPINTDKVQLFGGEAAIVVGSTSFQTEVVYSKIEDRATNDPGFLAATASGSWFPTGEHRAYKKSKAKFDRVKPIKNFGKGQAGAVELAGRVSYIDLDSGSVHGGKMTDITLGINWYLNPNTRFMFNYVHTDVDHSGNANIAQTRFQIDF